MGYAVDYKPTRKRTGRKQSPANKTKLRNLRAMVKYALPNIEQRCACSDTITRPELMALIGLSTKNPAHDLDMQTILSRQEWRRHPCARPCAGLEDLRLPGCGRVTETVVPLMGRRFLYARELAEFLGKSGQTLYMWRKQGRGPKWYMLEGRVVYLVDDVNKWMGKRQ